MSLVLAALLQADPSLDALAYLARHVDRRDCGCSPAKPGDPGRVVVAFLACGYSHLSGDTFGGVKFGDVVRSRLDAILAAQRDDGFFFPEDPAENAWMAFALAESAAGTGEKRLEAAARRAAYAVQGMPACDPEALFWQRVALASAGAGGLLPRAESVPSWESDAAALDVAKRDESSFFSPYHRRASHREWLKRLRSDWLPRQAREGPCAGSWESSVESTSYVAAALGRYCWACKTLGVFGPAKT